MNGFVGGVLYRVGIRQSIIEFADRIVCSVTASLAANFTAYFTTLLVGKHRFGQRDFDSVDTFVSFDFGCFFAFDVRSASSHQFLFDLFV